MATETEVERLVVRLMGDGKNYQQMLSAAQQQTTQYTRGIDGKLRDAQGRFVAGQGKMTASLGVTNSRIARISAALGRLSTRLKLTGTSFRSAGRSMSRLGRSLALRVTAPLALIGGLAVRAFASFDKAMIESTSIMGDLGDETKATMREVALALSGETIQSPKELAEAYFFLASAGKTAEQSMSLLPKVAQFATAGAFDMALATDLLTDAQSALGLTSKNVAIDTANLARVSDVLVKANTLANASVQQFSTALTSKAGAALKAYNKDVEEGVAVLAALADQGVKAELAGNALDRIIRLSTKGALDNAEAHKKLGFRVFDEAGKMRNLGDIIGNLEDVLEGMSDKQRAAALDALGFQARVQGVILPLLGTSKAIKRYEELLDDAGGTTKDVADKQMKSFSNQMKLFKNQLTLVAIDIGQLLAPALSKLTEILKEGFRWWKNLSPEIKKVVLIVAAAVAAIGPLLIILGGLVTSIGFVISGLGAMIGLLSAVLSPVGLIVAAIAAVIAVLAILAVKTGGVAKAVKFLVKKFMELKEIVQPAIDGVVNAIKAGNIELAFKIVWAQIKLSFAQGIQPLREAWVGFVLIFKRFWIEATTTIKSVWRKASDAIARGILKLQGLLDKGFDTEGAIAALDDMSRMAQQQLGDTREDMLKQAEKATAESMDQIRDDLKALEKQRDKLAKQAAKEAQEVAKAGIEDTVQEAEEQVAKIKNPPPLKLTFESPRAAVAAGSAEALARIAEFRTTVGMQVQEPRRGPEAERVRDDLKRLEDISIGIDRLVELGEDEADKPGVVIQGAGLQES